MAGRFRLDLLPLRFWFTGDSAFKESVKLAFLRLSQIADPLILSGVLPRRVAQRAGRVAVERDHVEGRR
jgi:hypothetical protein